MPKAQPTGCHGLLRAAVRSPRGLALISTTNAALGRLLLPFTGKNACRARKRRTATIPRRLQSCLFVTMR